MPPSTVRSVYTVAQDIDLLHAFYEGALGLPLAFRDRDRWCQFKAGPLPFALSSGAEAAPGARGSVISAGAQKTSEISLPVAITVFPDDVYRPPETWARRAYSNLIYFHEVDKGGHFAAWEQPELFSAELRAAFKSLRAAR